MNAADVTIKIRYCIWRDGRPRFVPAKDLRALGFKGKDLKHEDGRWFNIIETQAFVGELLQTVAERKTKKLDGKRLGKIPVQQHYLVADLFKDFFLRPEMQPQKEVRVKARAPNTVRYYKTMSKALRDFDAELWASPARAVNVVIAWGLYEKLYAERGLHMARSVIATCRSAWSWARKKGKVSENPFKDLGMETPEGRQRAGTVAEMKHLIGICDANQRPEIGDMVVLGFLTGQRQADRLDMEGGQIEGGRFRFYQAKMKKRISGPVKPILAARLEASRERRKKHKVKWPQVVIDEKLQRPYKVDHYRHEFARMVKLAAVAMPSIADFTDQDLRDTAITWARNGGADFEVRRKLSGHSVDSAQLEEDHYLANEETLGDDAVQAIMNVWEGKL